MNASLFDDLDVSSKASVTINDAPLAERLRPQTVNDVVGQEAALGEGTLLKACLDQGYVPNLILWGPPGCGKTTLARLLAAEIGYEFALISAVTSGVAELKKQFELASQRLKLHQKTLLMVDEIHRFNRAQQDVMLPFLEDGTVTLVGATTENPSFELNAALLSRSKVITLQSLDDHALGQLLARVEALYKRSLPLADDARDMLCSLADGDGRFLLNMCEQLMAIDVADKHYLGQDELASLLQKRSPRYDKNKDAHYDIISAFHKAMRGSDPQAALYWLARMLDAGEDRRYILRRMIRFASEDVGLADPQALVQANAALQAFDMLGMPEGDLAISQAVVYLASAPKSNAVYSAHKSALCAAKETGSLQPPKHILNAPTQLMKNEGYGQGYVYDHDTEFCFSGQDYFPDAVSGYEFYQPSPRGFEKELQKRLAYWQQLREKLND